MAIKQNLIDLMALALAISGWPAGPERRDAARPNPTRTLQGKIAPRTPAGKPPRLTRQIIQSTFQRQQPPAKTRRVDQVRARRNLQRRKHRIKQPRHTDARERRHEPDGVIVVFFVLIIFVPRLGIILVVARKWLEPLKRVDESKGRVARPLAA